MQAMHDEDSVPTITKFPILGPLGSVGMAHPKHSAQVAAIRATFSLEKAAFRQCTNSVALGKLEAYEMR